MNQFRIGSTYFPSKPGIVHKSPVDKPVAKPFEKWLQESIQTDRETKLTFSHHAIQRLQERGIHLASDDIERLSDAAKRAAEKGARESLIVMDDVAYIVSVRNNKVITAVDPASMKENVFTNIDSAVFV